MHHKFDATFIFFPNHTMDKEVMPKVDVKKDNLREIDIALMNQVERANKERVKHLKQLRRNNRILGLTLGFTTLSIYFYTIYTVKQERFLDDFEAPDPLIEPRITSSK